MNFAGTTRCSYTRVGVVNNNRILKLFGTSNKISSDITIPTDNNTDTSAASGIMLLIANDID